MNNKYIYLFFLLLPFLYLSCSSSKDQITSGTKYQIFKDTILDKNYYIYDSIKLYVIMPEELKNKNPQFLYEDSKGTPFVSLGEELYEIDIDTTNALYMGTLTNSITQSVQSKETTKSKIVKAKTRKKSRSVKKVKPVSSKKGS